MIKRTAKEMFMYIYDEDIQNNCSNVIDKLSDMVETGETFEIFCENHDGVFGGHYDEWFLISDIENDKELLTKVGKEYKYLLDEWYGRDFDITDLSSIVDFIIESDFYLCDII